MIRVIHMRGALWAIQSTSFSPILRDEAKRTPGMSWDGATRSWCGYGDAVSVTADRARRAGLRIIGNVVRSTGEYTIVPIAGANLRDYQIAGVKFAVANASSGVLLAWDVGLGKSAAFIRTARALRGEQGIALIVCPSFVRGVWADEAKRWWPEARVTSLAGTKADPTKLDVDIAIIHYDVVYAWAEALIAKGVRTLGLDEVQYCQSDRSRRTKACETLARAAVYRIGLSATPMTSRPRDLWAPVNVLSEGRFGKMFAYGLRHCDGHQEQVTPTKVVWKFDGASNLDELRTRLGFFMSWLTKSDVAFELPARTRQIIELEIPRGSMVAPTAAMRSDRILRKALDMSADGKVPQIIDLVVSHLEAGHKVVVGAHRKAIAQCIADGVAQKIPVTPAIITGEISLDKRKAIIDSKPDLICCTIDSTKVGINLSFASVGVVAELVWVPSDLIQWEGRFGRVEGKNILIQYVVAKATADDVIKHTVIAKLDKFQQAIGKTDDKLAEDFRGPKGVDRMRTLYERLMKED